MKGYCMTTALLSQKDAIARWPVLSEYVLNEARRLGHIEWVRGKYKAPFYTAEAIEAYIQQHRTQRCGKAEPEKQQRPGRVVTMSPELRDMAAKRLAARI